MELIIISCLPSTLEKHVKHFWSGKKLDWIKPNWESCVRNVLIEYVHCFKSRFFINKHSGFSIQTNKLKIISVQIELLVSYRYRGERDGIITSSQLNRLTWHYAKTGYTYTLILRNSKFVRSFAFSCDISDYFEKLAVLTYSLRNRFPFIHFPNKEVFRKIFRFTGDVQYLPGVALNSHSSLKCQTNSICVVKKPHSYDYFCRQRLENLD